MKVLALSIPRVIHWGKLFIITGGAQFLVQAAGLVTGFFVLRMLTVQQYALYTLANTMLGTLTVLADSGISNGVMSQSGKVWQHKIKLGAVIATGLDLRKRFAVISLIVSVPVLFYLLLHHGANWGSSILIVISIIPAFFAALSDSLLEIVPKLHQDIKLLQKNQVAVGVGRLLLSLLLVFVFPLAFIVVLCNGIPRIYGNLRLRKIAGRHAEFNQPPNPVIRRSIIAVVKRVMPISVYYCISGQLTLWFISLFGKTASIAQMGALGRIAFIMNFFSVIISTLIIPRFARMHADRKTLAKRYAGILTGVILNCAILTVLAYLFSSQILLLLGRNYTGLDHALLLCIIGSSLGLLTNVAFGLISSRGFFMHTVFLIIVNVLSIVVAIFFFNLATLQGILWFNIMVEGISFLLAVCYSYYQLKKNSSFAVNDAVH